MILWHFYVLTDFSALGFSFLVSFFIHLLAHWFVLLFWRNNFSHFFRKGICVLGSFLISENIIVVFSSNKCLVATSWLTPWLTHFPCKMCDFLSVPPKWCFGGLWEPSVFYFFMHNLMCSYLLENFLKFVPNFFSVQYDSHCFHCNLKFKNQIL